MAWISAGGSGSVEDKNSTINTQTDAYGTHSPVIDPAFQAAFNAATGGVSSSGANPTQQTGIDWLTSNLANNPAMAALYNANVNLQPVKTQLGGLATQFQTNAGQSPLQATGSTAATPAPVSATSGSDFISKYMSPYTNDVVNSTLGDLSHANDQSANTLKMAAAAGGAFGGGRQGVTEANNNDNYLRNVASTSANLRNLGFTSALNPATADASRVLGADQGNQSTTADINKFNAGQDQQNSQFNVNAGVQQRQLSDNELTSAQSAITAQAGLTQQQAQNVVTANGINMEAAQSLLAAGSITQDQLNQIVNMAQQFNGSSFTQNTGSSTHANTIDVKAEAHGGIGS